MNLAIIKHDNDYRKFLFQVPDHVYLKKGDRVICKTRHGESNGTCVYDGFMLNGPALDIFIREIGAKKPLAPIIGEYQKVMYTVKVDADIDITVKRYKMLNGDSLPYTACKHAPPAVEKICCQICPAEGGVISDDRSL